MSEVQSYISNPMMQQLLIMMQGDELQPQHMTYHSWCWCEDFVVCIQLVIMVFLSLSDMLTTVKSKYKGYRYILIEMSIGIQSA